MRIQRGLSFKLISVVLITLVAAFVGMSVMVLRVVTANNAAIVDSTLSELKRQESKILDRLDQERARTAAHLQARSARWY